MNKSENIEVITKVDMNNIDGFIRDPKTLEYIDLREYSLEVLSTFEIDTYEVKIAKLKGNYYLITPGSMPYQAFPEEFRRDEDVIDFGDDYNTFDILGARFYYMRKRELLALCYHLQQWGMLRRFIGEIPDENFVA